MRSFYFRSLIARRVMLYSFGLVLIVGSLATLGAGIAEARSSSELLEQLQNPNGPVMVVSHKGDWRNHPENSLSGIQAAIDMGVEIIEIDIQRTSDGVLVLMHDTDVNRMTNGTGNVSSKTLAQIKSLNLRKGEGAGAPH